MTMSKTARIEWQDEFIEIDDTENPDIGQLESAMRFKAEHIKAKADPQLFECVADTLNNLTEYIFKGAYLKHGHWEAGPHQFVQCSSCNVGIWTVGQFQEVVRDNLDKYCPSCGAKMDEVIE